MTDLQHRVRRQQQFEELSASTIRALVGDRQLHFRGQRIHRTEELLPAFAPHLHPSIDENDFTAFRGAADGIALRLVYSDLGLHQRMAPSDPIERVLFDLLEQLRVESLAPETMPGLRHNLKQRFEQWSDAFVTSGLAETARGILLLTLAHAVRVRLSREPTPARIADLIETTTVMLVGRTAHDMAALRRLRTDQQAFAKHALNIVEVVSSLLTSRDDESGDEKHDREENQRVLASMQLMLAPEGDGEGGAPLASSGKSRVLSDSGAGYQIFTRSYDREVDGESQVRLALLLEYREQLDDLIKAHRINLPRLARELKHLLATPEVDGWDSAQESGRIDGRRIAQLISSPFERRLFRTEHLEPVADSMVTFLIDCSGSMKNQIHSVAVIVDVFARALEMAGVASEILGFTTGAWNGGRAQRDWLRAGRPAHPGRLNERHHIVFKSADMTWRQARRSVACLFKPDLFREGIDGEAVEWAVARMEGRSEARRFLLVVSDGSPMDTATSLANDPHYLDHHLRDVIRRLESGGRVGIFGIGIGLDLTPYYRHNRIVDLSDANGNRICRELLDLIGSTQRF